MANANMYSFALGGGVGGIINLYDIAENTHERADDALLLINSNLPPPPSAARMPDHRGSQGRRLGGPLSLSLADGRTRAMSHRTAKRKSVFPGQRGGGG